MQLEHSLCVCDSYISMLVPLLVDNRPILPETIYSRCFRQRRQQRRYREQLRLKDKQEHYDQLGTPLTLLEVKTNASELPPSLPTIQLDHQHFGRSSGRAMLVAANEMTDEERAIENNSTPPDFYINSVSARN